MWIWSFPNVHLSARYRHAYKIMRGTYEGYIVAAHSKATSLSHSHGQHSVVLMNMSLMEIPRPQV
ncbi:unnamed protein product [Rhodiola kirilowii]